VPWCRHVVPLRGAVTWCSHMVVCRLERQASPVPRTCTQERRRNFSATRQHPFSVHSYTEPVEGYTNTCQLACTCASHTSMQHKHTSMLVCLYKHASIYKQAYKHTDMYFTYKHASMWRTCACTYKHQDAVRAAYREGRTEYTLTLYKERVQGYKTLYAYTVKGTCTRIYAYSVEGTCTRVHNAMRLLCRRNLYRDTQIHASSCASHTARSLPRGPHRVYAYSAEGSWTRTYAFSAEGSWTRIYAYSVKGTCTRIHKAIRLLCKRNLYKDVRRYTSPLQREAGQGYTNIRKLCSHHI
jgi:hypothetical protein